MIFLAVGWLVPYKGFDLTLEAMRDSQSLAACRLRIVGDGPERGRLEALAAQFRLGDRVEFFGWMDQGAVSRELASARALVFLSLRELGGRPRIGCGPNSRGRRNRRASPHSNGTFFRFPVSLARAGEDTLA